MNVVEGSTGPESPPRCSDPECPARSSRPRRGARQAAGLASLIAVVSLAAPAWAHSLNDSATGFGAGFVHPFSGLDHLLAMVSVGIWGAELGPPALWLLPITFPLIMALGGALGVIGVPLPGGELLIALSVLVLGALIGLAQRLPLWLATVIVGIFAVAHGHAHGVELPLSSDALSFTIGFVIATGILHLAGIAIGLVSRWPGGIVAIRAAGVLVALAGCYLVYLDAAA